MSDPHHNLPRQPYPTTPPTTAPPTHPPTTTNTTSNNSMNNANDPAVLDLLGNYPFIQYTPGSRVAKHLQTLNITRPSSFTPSTYPSNSPSTYPLTSSSSNNPMMYSADPKVMYPQYRGTFERMDRVLAGAGGAYDTAAGYQGGNQGQAMGQGQPDPQQQSNGGYHPQNGSVGGPQYAPPLHAQGQSQASYIPQPQLPTPPPPQPTSIRQTDQEMTRSNVQRVVGYMNDLAPVYGFGGNASAGRGNPSGNVIPNGGYGAVPVNGGAGSWIPPVMRNGQGNGQVKERIDLTRSGSYGNMPMSNPFYDASSMGYASASGSGQGQSFNPANRLHPHPQGQARQPAQASASAGLPHYNSQSPNFLMDLTRHVVPPSTLSGFASTGYGLSGVGAGDSWDGYQAQQQSQQYKQPPTNSSASPGPSRQPTYQANESRAFFDGYLAQVEGKRTAEVELAKAKEVERLENERRERQRAMKAQEERRVKPPSVSPQKRRVEDFLGGGLEEKKPKQATTNAGTGGGVRLVPFVEIPVKKTAKMGGYRSMDDDEMDDDDDEDEDDEGDDDYRDYQMNRSARRLSDSGMAMMTPDTFKTDVTPTRRNGFTSVAGRSVKKDHQKALYRFVEDIFEAEDALPADFTQEDLQSSGPFGGLTRRAREDEKALLKRSTVDKLSGMFKQCTRSKKTRTRRGVNAVRDGQNGNVPENLASWPTEELTRLVKLLERNMIEIEGVVVFPDDGYSARAKKDVEEDSPKDKGRPVKKKVRASKADSEDITASVQLSSHDIDAAVDKLDVLVDAVIASECIMSLLTADDLAKPLYSEDVIREALDAASLAINEIIMPFLEAVSGTSSISSSLLAYVALQTDDSARRIRQSILALAKSTTRQLHRLTRLIAHEGLTTPENLVYSITQIVVQLVFMVDPMTESKSGSGARPTAIWKEAMEGQAGTRAIKAEAMEVLKTLYLHQGSAERDEILKEVLAFTAKVADLKRNQTGYRTRKGKVIHFISALLLELMQTSAHGVIDMLDAADVAEMMDMDGEAGGQKSDTKLNTIALAAFIEDINRSARFILQYMLNKLSGAHIGKQKSSLEVNYRTILETFLEDQVEVLYLPEFPAAAISLGMTARTLISILDENKPTADNAAIRGLAIDHLGSLASNLRSFEMTYNGGVQALSLQQIVRTGNESAWRDLRDASQVLLHTLQKNASQNGLYSSAADVMTAEWLLNLHRTLKREETGDSDDGAEEDDHMRGGTSPILREIQTELVRASRKVEDESVFAHAKDDLLAQADRPCIMVEMTRDLQYALVHISKTILNCMSAPVVAQRTKAIRALGAAIAVDPVLLNRGDIRKSIQDRISDSSPAVRDAAIDLVGKYIPDKPDVALQYYPSISSRIADTGPAVRKRVVKLFKVIYDLVPKKSVRTEICCKLVGLVDDEEDSVKDLALATLADIWFPSDVGYGGRQNKRSDTPVSTTSSKDANEYQVHPIVDVVARYSNDMLPVELAIREISKDGSRGLSQEYSRLIGIMLDRLISEDTRSASETLPLVRSIHLLSNAKPQAMDLQRATSLLPYLRQASTPEEVVLCETLMRIFRTSIPCLPKSASNFAVELSKVLLPMIAKPSGRLSTLEEAVMCYCAVVTHLTQEYSRILTILKSCIRKIRTETVKAEKSGSRTPTDQKTLPFIATIASLLVAKSDLDAVKEERTEVDEAIYDMTGNDDVSISIYLFETLLGLWSLNLDQVMRHAVIQCFGHVYQAFPTLMTHESSIAVMDSVLKGDAANHHTTLKMFTLIYDTLSTLVESNQNKNGEDETGSDPVDMDKLIGNTAGFAESGVGSAIIQRYIDKVLHAALSSDNDVQKVAIDILSLTINQGLAHPIQSFPIIVTLETSDSLHVSEKAFGLHSHLQAKHASIINSRYFESAKVVFDYRKGLDPEAIGHSKSDHPTALLDRWYSLIRDKRPIRQDFLKAMCKAFTFEISPPNVTWDDVLLARFMAENLALLEYKVQEEVLQIVSVMTTLLASLGMQVVELLKGTKIVGEAHASLTEASLIKDDEDGDGMEQDDSQASHVDYNIEALINASAMVGIALLLKNRLKKTYGLTEDKIIKYQPGKKTVLTDRSVTKKITDGSAGLPEWDNLPGIKGRVINVKGYQDQAIAFLGLIEEDGTMRPEYDPEEVEEEDYQGKS